MLSFDDYRRHDAVGLAALVSRGETSATELLDTALARCDAVEPRIRSVSQLHEDFARAAIRNGLPDGPLRGVPFLLKDVSVQLAGTVTTNGGRYFEGAVAERDSTVVERYRRAGLVIFGKTMTPEMGLAASTETSHKGSTRNPWNLERTAGGSSGGAAAAVAAGIVPAAQGSDGGGSIRIPASCCGLFGLKPTRARVPLGPFVGESWGGMGVVHVLSRSVRDSAALLDATAGAAAGDPYAAPHQARPYLEEVGADPGRLRIAFQRRPVSGSPVDGECIAAAEDAARLLDSLGHHVEEATLPATIDDIGPAAWALVATGVAATLERRARMLGRPLEEHDVEPVTWRAVLHARSLSALAHHEALAAIHRHGRRMAEFRERHDIVLSPTLGQPPVPLGVQRMNNADGEAYAAALHRFTPFCNVFNMSGEPSMSVPLHWTVDGLPVGTMLSGAFGREDLLIRLGAQLERARPWFERVPPL
ncbi:MAG TPA: amidase [Caldimonas sp.]|nr:amidase [Caldimonas sp.]